MHFEMEDLGVQAYGDIWLAWRYAKHPETRADLALGALSRGGFMLIDPLTRECTQVRPERPVSAGWAVGQGPGGEIYYSGMPRDEPGAKNTVFRWDWQGQVARPWGETPGGMVFTLDIAPDGAVYIPAHQTNRLYRLDADGKAEEVACFDEFGEHGRNVCCAADGRVYVTCLTYGDDPRIVVFDPESGEVSEVETGAAEGAGKWHFTAIAKNADGEAFAGRTLWDGSTFWYKLGDGRPTPIDQRQTGLTQHGQPLVFGDGSRIGEIKDRQVTYTDAAGRSSHFTIEREDSPLRIFSVISGGRNIWGGTFIPLTLFSYDPRTGQSTSYGNPTKTDGEIYNMAYAADKLFMASYTRATLTRYAPEQSPWAGGQGDNPAHLGQMKEGELPLHRPYGVATDGEGNVYFAARGDYGCRDSGICRIYPETEELTRWLYPNTTMSAMTYLPATNQLVVAETRDGEEGIRFTLVSPQTGEIEWSQIVIPDKGQVESWLYVEGEGLYGLHAYRATLFRFYLESKRIEAQLEEMRVGEHCHSALLLGPDERIWGLTNRCVYAVDRELKKAEIIAEYADHAGGNAYRFGMCQGPDGSIYFPNGAHLMRVVVKE